jgi:hypothetical protein
MKVGQYEILDTANWNVEKDLPGYDYHYEGPLYIRTDFACERIPSDFACGIKARYDYDGKTYTSKYYRKPLVTLVITTWKGMCVEAVHYNGRFDIRLPELEEDGQEGHTISCSSIPIFSNDRIVLTQTITEFDIKKFPYNYRYYRVGQRHPGFPGVKSLTMYAEEQFNKIFDKGWNYKIEKRF